MDEENNNEKTSLTKLLSEQLEALNEQNKKLMVACSGGLDSTALLFLLSQVTKQKKNFSLAVCHTNFGLRPVDSDLDQAFVEKLAQKYEVPAHIQKVTPEERQSRRSQSVQEWARNVRYKWFRQLASEGWVIALGHHQDDLAENTLLRLARGTSPGSMAGLSHWNPPFWRPLLNASRVQLEALARQEQLEFREDKSNLSTDYSRNLIRLEVLPLLEKLYPGAAARIARCARDASDLTELCTESLAEEISLLRGDGLGRKFMSELNQGTLFLLISQGVGVARKGRKALSAHFLERAADFIRDSEEQDFVLELPAGKGMLSGKNGLVKIIPPKKAK